MSDGRADKKKAFAAKPCLFEMDKKDMRKIMSDLGVKMEEEQLRRVIDAFDSNGDGTVSKDEFLNFCNPDGNPSRPAVRGDTAAVLERKCIHETSCCFTGMPNAFVVTASCKKVDSEDNVKIIKKKDGTFRRIVELEERRKRWALLANFGLLKKTDDDRINECVCERSARRAGGRGGWEGAAEPLHLAESSLVAVSRLLPPP